jgi:hypothetical protein
VFLSADDDQNRIINELTYFTNISDPTTRTRLPNALDDVGGPTGLGDQMPTDRWLHQYPSADQWLAARRWRGFDPLVSTPPILVHTSTENLDPNADTQRSPVDFYQSGHV